MGHLQEKRGLGMMRVRKGGIGVREGWEKGVGDEGRRERRKWGGGEEVGVGGGRRERRCRTRPFKSPRLHPPRRPGVGRGGGGGAASPPQSPLRPLPRPLLRPAARPPRRRRSGNMKRRCSCGGGVGHYSSEQRARRWRPGRDAAGSGAERTGARIRPGRARGAHRLRGSAPRSPRAAFPGYGAPRCGRLIAGLARPHAGWGREAESPRCLCAGVLAPLGAAASSRCPGPEAGG